MGKIKEMEEKDGTGWRWEETGGEWEERGRNG